MKRLFSGFVLLLGLIFGLYFLVSLPYFAITKIQYDGLNFTSFSRLDALFSPLQGRSIFSIYFLKNYHQKAIAENPSIAEIDIIAKFPRTLRVVMQEKDIWVSFLTHPFFPNMDY